MYRYGMQYRPPYSGGIPHGVRYEWDKFYRDESLGIRHGVISVDVRFTEAQIEAFELIDLNEGESE